MHMWMFITYRQLFVLRYSCGAHRTSVQRRSILDWCGRKQQGDKPVKPFRDAILLLPLSQIIKRFGIFRFIIFAMYLDITYIQVHSKSYESRKAKTSYNLEWRDYIFSCSDMFFFQQGVMLNSWYSVFLFVSHIWISKETYSFSSPLLFQYSCSNILAHD